MRFAVETWAPDYGAPVDADVARATSDAEVDVTVERRPADWAPVAPVRRRRPRRCCSSTASSGSTPGCGSTATATGPAPGRGVRVVGRRGGALRRPRHGGRRPRSSGACCARATASRRHRHPPRPLPPALGARRWPAATPVGQALGRVRGDLEGRVAVRAGRPTGTCWSSTARCGDRRTIAGAVGYVKAHHVAYLDAGLQRVVGDLGAGERTPLFTVGDRRFRYSWYVRLPGPGHPRLVGRRPVRGARRPGPGGRGGGGGPGGGHAAPLRQPAPQRPPRRRRTCTRSPASSASSSGASATPRCWSGPCGRPRPPPRPRSRSRSAPRPPRPGWGRGRRRCGPWPAAAARTRPATACRPRRGDDALLPRAPPRDRPARRRCRRPWAAPPARRRRTGVPGDQHVRVAHGGGHPGLLGAVDQVVEQHAQPPLGPGPEVGDHVGQVVHAVEPLDDHALDPQVVAPHLLDQLGVVDALDQDAAGPGHPRRLVAHRGRSRGGAPGPWERRAGVGGTSVTGGRRPGTPPGSRRTSRRVPVLRSRMATPPCSKPRTAPSTPVDRCSTSRPGRPSTSGGPAAGAGGRRGRAGPERMPSPGIGMATAHRVRVAGGPPVPGAVSDLVDAQGRGRPSRPGKPLFADLSLTLSTGDRLAVVGINGTRQVDAARRPGRDGRARGRRGAPRAGAPGSSPSTRRRCCPPARCATAVGGGWEGEAVLDRLGMGDLLDADVAAAVGRPGQAGGAGPGAGRVGEAPSATC